MALLRRVLRALAVAAAERRSNAAVLVTAAFTLVAGATLRAHDPGLSSLLLQAGPDGIAATVSLSAADAALAAGGGRLDTILLDAIALEVDGARLAGAVTGVTVDADTGTTLHALFETPPGARLVVRSALPARLTPGHRELLTVRRGDGQVIASRMLDRTSGETTIDLASMAAAGPAGADFVVLGVRHILGGADHLLFLAALLLGPGRLRGAVRTVTAFTVAHSVTLSLAVLGLVPAPAAIIEPLIALSIVWVGLENLRGRPAGRSRAALTFAFGLVHGLGFASALGELGIGAAGGAALPLLAFNAGVEVGQVAVVLLVWGLLRALDARPRLRLCVEACSSLAVAVAGACWFVARVAG